MSFEITIKEISMINSTGMEDALLDFIYMIGLISARQRYDRAEGLKSIPYNLFANFFLKKPEKPWQVNELAEALKKSRPSVYKYINMLKEMNFLEESEIVDNDVHMKGARKKGYRIKFGNVEKAWGIVDAHIKVILRSYEENVRYIQKIIEENHKNYL